MDEIELKVDLKGEIAKKFLYLKEVLGLKDKDDESVLIRLINERYRHLNPETPQEKERKP